MNVHLCVHIHSSDQVDRQFDSGFNNTTVIGLFIISAEKYMRKHVTKILIHNVHTYYILYQNIIYEL